MRTGTVAGGGRWVLIVLGGLSILFTLWEAIFNTSRIAEDVLAKFGVVTMNDTILASPNYLFERWLAIALFVTVILNIVLYATNFFSALLLFRAHEEREREPFLTMLLLLGVQVISIALGVVFPL